MGVVQSGGHYYWVKRVPKRFLPYVRGKQGQPITQVRQYIKADSLTRAKAKAGQIEAARLAEWEALCAEDQASARQHYLAARKLALANGFSYMPVSELAEGDLQEIVRRLRFIESNPAKDSSAVVSAVLGAAPVVLPNLCEVLDEYYTLTKTRHLKKSDRQIHRWRLPRERAVRNFLKVAYGLDGDKAKDTAPPINEITRSDALKFRQWWSARVENGMAVASANKDFGHLGEILTTWAERTDTEFANPFSKLRLEGKDESHTPAFSKAWVKTKLLNPTAFAGLNSEARDVFLTMINTGLRPSEITDAPIEDYCITGSIPFIRVAPHGRELKVIHTRRDIPLLGVSLASARRICESGGIKRYRHNAGSWSALVNKFMKTNGLKETPKHVAYSIRHYVENALLAAKVDDRVRADILGHKYNRPNYGDGGGLSGRRDALAKIAL